MKTKKILVLGDSISEGLGSKKINFISAMEAALNGNKEIEEYEIGNLALSGTTIDYALQIEQQIDKYNPDIILFFYGNVEAICRPIMKEDSVLYSILPAKYKNNISMVDPRPFYSHKLSKKILQKGDSLFRFCVRRYFFNRYGYYNLLPLEDFKKKSIQFIERELEKSRKLLMVSNVRVDDFFFPKSSDSFAQYREIQKNLAKHYGIYYINLYEWQCNYKWEEIYGNDHYHPNPQGYNLMGEFFAKEILEAEKQWGDTRHH